MADKHQTDEIKLILYLVYLAWMTGGFKKAEPILELAKKRTVEIGSTDSFVGVLNTYSQLVTSV